MILKEYLARALLLLILQNEEIRIQKDKLTYPT